MKRAQTEQLSLFDIVLNKTQELPPPMLQIEKRSTLQKEPCPYRIPTLEEIVKQIDKVCARVNGSKFISDVFECAAIAISNLVDLPQYDGREERYLSIVRSYQKEEQDAMVKIIGLIYSLLNSMVYKEGVFDDYLGKLFMQSNLGNSKSGQFFTPYTVSKCMARIAVTDDAIKRGRILTINDPCCGGGGMLIAAIDELENQYGVNYAHDCFIVGSDIDLRCVHMTYLQLSLAGAPAVVKHQDTLTKETWSVWRTPAYILQYMRFRRYENYC